MRAKIIILLLLAFFSVLPLSADVEKTPPQYQTVEKALKKEYGKVLFKGDFFIVKNKKDNFWAAATLDGKVFSNFCEVPSIDHLPKRFFVKNLDGKKYIIAPSFESKNRSALYNLAGDIKIPMCNGICQELKVGDETFFIFDFFERRGRQGPHRYLYNSNYDKILDWFDHIYEDGVFSVEKFCDQYFFVFKHVPDSRIFAINGKVLREDIQEISELRTNGKNLIVFHVSPYDLYVAAHYNPETYSLEYVYDESIIKGAKGVTLNGEQYYLKINCLYGLDGTRLNLPYLIDKVIPNGFIVHEGNKKGAINDNSEFITPIKWNELEHHKTNDYCYFVGTLKSNDSTTKYLIDLAGMEYPIPEPRNYSGNIRDLYLNFDFTGNDVTLSYTTDIGFIKDSQKIVGALPQNFRTGLSKPSEVQPQGTIYATNTVGKDFPSLDIVEGTLRFVDPSGRNAINVESAYQIEFEVKNSGKGFARNCKPVVTVKSGGKGISVQKSPEISIAPGSTCKVQIPVVASLDVAEGTAEFAVRVDEPNGFGSGESMLGVNTHAFEAPKVLVNDYTVTSEGGTTLQRKMPFDLQLLIQNMSHGRADDVTVTLNLPRNVFVIEGNPNESLNTLEGGQTKELVYTIVANNNYESDVIPVKVDVREKLGKYAESRNIELQINQPLTASRIMVDEATTGPRKEIEMARLNSDVDVNIPDGQRTANNTFAVIIANENYSQVAKVPHAANDGLIFAQYCRTTLGIPERNIRVVTNATLNEMKRNVNWLTQVGQTFGKDANLIFYYSGHGVPDESTGQAYILPVDGYHSDMVTNYALSDLYSALNSTGAGRVTVFMDACFSGAHRGDGMLMAARGVQIKAKTEAPKGNMIVFSASQGDETAYPYDSQNHGMFTYYLLKKLQSTKGHLTLGELSDFITDEVKKTSLLENSKIQTPQIQISPAIADSWRTLPL